MGLLTSRGKEDGKLDTFFPINPKTLLPHLPDTVELVRRLDGSGVASEMGALEQTNWKTTSQKRGRGSKNSMSHIFVKIVLPR